MSTVAIDWWTPDSAVSEEARVLREATVRAARSETAMSPEADRRLRALVAAATEAAVDDWDGYNAAGASEAATAFAGQVLQSIPKGWPSPEIAVDPDGDISLEWSLGPERVFTVSVSSKGILHYAGLFGDSKTHGAEAFLGQLPSAIVGNLERLYLRAPAFTRADAR